MLIDPNKEIIVNGWIETSHGKVLNWKGTGKKTAKKKFNEKQINTIINIKHKYTHASQDILISKLDLEHGIKISKTTLKKIVENNY